MHTKPAESFGRGPVCFETILRYDDTPQSNWVRDSLVTNNDTTTALVTVTTLFRDEKPTSNWVRDILVTNIDTTTTLVSENAL